MAQPKIAKKETVITHAKRPRLLLSRPSTWVAFWALCSTAPLYTFQTLPFRGYESTNLAITFLLLLTSLAIVIRIAESTLLKGMKQTGYPKIKLSKTWHYKIKVITITSTVISIATILGSLAFVFIYSDLSISSAQDTLNDKTPTFGKVFSHLRSIAIPGIVILNTHSRLRWASPTILIFFILSALLSFLGGERLFFFETALTYLIAREIVGCPIVTLKNSALFVVISLLFFSVVESGKRYFSRGYDVEFNIVRDIGYFIERPIGYYADPISKLYFTIEKQTPQTTFIWYEFAINRYAERLGLEIDIPSAGTNDTYWQAGYGYTGLTNPGGFTILYKDFGAISILLLLVSLLVSFILLHGIISRRITPLAIFYPLLMVALFEMPRVPYIYWPRCWLAIIFSTLLYSILTFSKKAKFAKTQRNKNLISY